MYQIYTQYIKKRYFIHFLLLVFKIVERLECILKYVIFCSLNLVKYIQIIINPQKFSIYLVIHSSPLLYFQGKMSLTPDEKKIVDYVVKETMGSIMKYDPKYYDKLMHNPDYTKSVTDAAKGIALEQVPLSKHFNQEPPNIEQIISQHLPEERIDLLKNGLSISTFRLGLSKKLDDEKFIAAFTRNNLNLWQPRILSSMTSIDWTTIKQYASLVVEAVMLVMSVVGISVTPDERVIEQAVDEAAHVIQTNSKFQQTILKFIDSWKTASC